MPSRPKRFKFNYNGYSWVTFGSYVSIPFFYIKTGHKEYIYNSISLATICDLHLLSDAQELSNSYHSGPISFGIYIDKDYRTHNKNTHGKLTLLFDKYFQNISNEYDIIIGILYINNDSLPWQQRKFTTDTPMMLKLPTNSLRNLAEYQVRSEWVFNIDIDFCYLSKTFLNITQILAEMRDISWHYHKTVFIVPAFEILYKKDILNMNKYKLLNKNELIELIFDHGEIAQFHSQMQAQKCTNYNKWYSSTNHYRLNVTERRCYRAYEPWYIMKTNMSKQYNWDDKFIGRGLNKVDRAYTLRHKCFRFVVLDDLFMIHSLSLHFGKDNKIFAKNNNTLELELHQQKLKWHEFNKILFEKKRKQFRLNENSCLHNHSPWPTILKYLWNMLLIIMWISIIIIVSTPVCVAIYCCYL